MPSSKIRVMSDCPLWRARRSAPWLSSSVLLRPGSSSWRRHLWHGTDPTRRAAVWRRFPDGAGLATIPGVGVITATALVATIGDGAQFRSGRQLSAWLGLVPRQHSSGGKDRLGRISKRGDGYIRRLLVHGARSVLRWRRAKPGTRPGWSDQLLARRPTNVVLVAMANKTTRVAWALLRYERIYRPTHA